MGGLEEGRRRELRRTKVQQAVLETIYLAGILSVALVAPNAVKLFTPLEKRKRKADPKYAANRALKRLLDAGYVVFEEGEKGKRVCLTKKGEHFMALAAQRRFRFQKPAKWDGQWRLIIFDISEKHKKLREKFRLTLTDIGFVRLQDSVWVYPYDCEDFITLLKADFKIGKDILYIIAARIENDGGLRHHFGLH
jgi:hypothetical protein